jgi:hypothetical protein
VICCLQVGDPGQAVVIIQFMSENLRTMGGDDANPRSRAGKDEVFYLK